MFTKLVLPYSFAALEPYIDSQTMETHYGKHYEGYTSKLNAAIEGTEYADKSVEELLMNLSSLPEDKQTEVRNNGGGYVNHTQFFASLRMNQDGTPKGELADAIDSAFGSFDSFKQEFSAKAGSLFGSGWVWLATDEKGENLHISQLPNQDSPLMSNHKPILGIDIWEHAYYLKYQNRRAEYIENFWNIINWEKVNEYYVGARG